MARRREAILFPSLLVVACFAAAATWAVHERRTLRGRVEREDTALAAVRRVAEAERLHHEATGTYAWIDALQGAGRLGDLRVETLEGRAVVRTPGYRLDVLLPMSAARIVPAGGPPADATLSRTHFAVVARPVVPGVDGYRIWYLDERGDVYAAEGAVDPETSRRNELPDWPVGLVSGTAGARLGDWQKIP